MLPMSLDSEEAAFLNPHFSLTWKQVVVVTQLLTENVKALCTCSKMPFVFQRSFLALKTDFKAILG